MNKRNVSIDCSCKSWTEDNRFSQPCKNFELNNQWKSKTESGFAIDKRKRYLSAYCYEDSEDKINNLGVLNKRNLQVPSGIRDLLAPSVRIMQDCYSVATV